jgi:hypothetical protein
MNQIRLEWSRFPDSPLVSVDARGVDHARLRSYAQRVGFVSFQDDDGYPVLIGTNGQRGDLRHVLESAGYDVCEEVEVL